MPLQLGLWEESNQCSWLGLLESLWDLLRVPRGSAVLTVHLAMHPQKMLDSFVPVFINIC